MHAVTEHEWLAIIMPSRAEFVPRRVSHGAANDNVVASNPTSERRFWPVSDDERQSKYCSAQQQHGCRLVTPNPPVPSGSSRAHLCLVPSGGRKGRIGGCATQ